MKGLFKLLGALFTFQLGAVVAMLFAQKTGKTLRKDLKKSDNPLKVLFQEGLKIDKEILGNVKDWAENSENIQEVRNQIRDVKKHAVDMTDEAKAEMQKNLEKMADEAKAAAAELKKTAKKKTVAATKKAGSATRKKITKAKKTAVKSSAKAKKTVKKTTTKAVKKAKKV